MAEYALGVYRRLRRFPRQIVLYVGEPALAMQPSLTGDRFSFSYELRDLRDRDGDKKLESPHLSDSVLVSRAGPIEGSADGGESGCAAHCGPGNYRARKGSQAVDDSGRSSQTGRDGGKGDQEDAGSVGHFGS